MTGYGTSLSLLGMPDAGLATMSEMHLNARYIANAVQRMTSVASMLKLCDWPTATALPT